MDGIILINKPKEYTSHDIVAIIKRITKTKVGHTGTLDPMATGVLPLLLGKATLISKYLINHDKEYIVTIKLGEKTDTADSEGNIIEKRNVETYTIEQINFAINQIIGKQKQKPPIYSAIKINGKKLYEYARKGIKIEVPLREIEIYNAKLIEYLKEKQEITFKVKCSKGTYIRTVCEQIAENLNTIGYMKELNRIQVGDFKINQTINLEQAKNIGNINKSLISLEDFFSNKEKIVLNENQTKLLINGVKIKTKKNDGIYRIYLNKLFIGIAICKDNILKRDIII